MPSSPWRPRGDHESAFEERDGGFETSTEVFDRVEFVMSALELVRPPKMTVAVCAGSSRLRVLAGRVWGRADGARWAMVCVPLAASREAIVLALTELTGGLDRVDAPYTLDVLVARARTPDATRTGER